MSKSIKEFFELRLPGGDLYRRRSKTKKLLDYAKKYDNKHLLPFAKYLYESTTHIYYHGGKTFEYSLELMDKYFDIEDEMIILGNVKIPKPELNELLLFEYEFFDLCMPSLIQENDTAYNVFYNEGPYELDTQVSIQEDDIVFDCGANMGYFSALASNKVGSRGKVYSFEPSSQVIDKYLSKTEKYNDNIIIEQKALSDREGLMKIALDTNNIGASSLVIKSEICEFENVKLTTIDNYVTENNIPYVSYIKADIEGAERDMLKGAKNVLKKFAPKLSICTYHFPDDPEVLEEIIKSANPNYVVKHEFKKLYAYCPK